MRYCIFIIVIICGCASNISIDSNVKSITEQTGENIHDTLIKSVFIGNETNIKELNKTNPINLIHYLNISELDSVKLYLSRLNHDTILRGGMFNEIVLKTGNPWDSYVSYRLNEYFDDIDFHVYPSKIIESFGSVTDSVYTNIYLDESLYIQFMDDREPFLEDTSLRYQRQRTKDDKNNYRSKYLLARMFSKQKHFKEAEILYKELISRKYYEQKCLLELSRIYYLSNDSKDLLETIKVQEQAFPHSCNRYSLIIDFISEKEFLNYYNRCIKFGSKKDCIHAKMAYAEYLLKNKNFSNYIEKELNFEIYYTDSFGYMVENKIFEIFVKYYFATNKTEKLCQYIKTNHSIDPLYIVNSKDDLFRVLKRINSETRTIVNFDQYFYNNYNCL